MLWFTVWSVLVAGTLVGAFFLGRRLWRSGVALGRELAVAARTWESHADRLEELQDLAARQPATGPSVLADRAPLLARREALREERRARRDARDERHDRTRQSWQAYWR